MEAPHTLNAHLQAQHLWERAAIGGLRCSTPMGVEVPLGLKGTDSAMPKPLITSSQVSQCAAMPKDILTTSNQSLTIPTSCIKISDCSQCSPTPWSGTHPRADPGTLSEEVLQLQMEMNTAMGQLLTTRASIDSH